MKELRVVQPTIKNMVAAKIDFNKEEVKTYLEDMLFMYGKEVVTEDTVKDAKQTCADLNKLSKSIDTFRKDTKKALIAEVTQFESDVKEIKGIIDATYKPIKDQVDHFTELKRQEKEEIVTGIIGAVRHEMNVRDEFFKLFDSNSSWLNASTSANKIRQEVELEMNRILMVQQMHDTKIDAISSILAAYNEKLRFKYNIIDFERYIDTMDLSELTAYVKESVEKRFNDEQAELKRIEEEKQAAIERAKAAAEAEAQRKIEEEERRHQAELEAAEYKRERELREQEDKASVQIQEAFESFEQFVPEDVQETEEPELTIKYKISATKSKLDALEKYLEQFEFDYELIF